MIKKHRPAAILSATAALALLLSGCSTGQAPASDSASASDGRVLQVATITGALPYQSLDTDGKTVIGYEPDLIREVASRIGAKVNFTILDFDALLPGVDSGRFDVALAGFSDKPARQDKYDMVDAANDKFGFAALPALAGSIKTWRDVCGHSAGGLSGGSYIAVFQNWSSKCEAEGLSPIKIVTYDADSQGFLSVKSGQVDLWASAVPIVANWASENGAEVTPLSFMENPNAFVLKKGSAFTPEIMSALQSMMDDGTYLKILQKWKVQDIARDKATLNQGKTVTE